MLTGSVLHALAITVPIGVPLFALACVAVGGIDSLAAFELPAWLWLAGAGIIHFVVGRYGNYRATRALGAALSIPVQQLSVPIAVVLALLFLGEFMTPLRLIGFCLVMAGPFVSIGSRRSRDDKQAPSGFRPHYAEGVLWSAVCAFGYGISPIMIVFGLGAERSITESLAGGLISYAAATIVLMIPIAAAGGTRFLRQLDRTAGKWFLVSGVFVFVSHMLRYMALAVAPVTVVVPIQRLSVIFRVIFSWLINRRHEVLSTRVLTGIALSLGGVLALTVSPELAASALPDGWAWLAELRWPS